MYEIFGLLSFAEKKKDNVKNTIAGLNIDMVGEDEASTDAVLRIGKTWPSNPSFVNDLLLNIAEENYAWKPGRHKESGYEFSDHDSFICEPNIGIPTPFLLYEKDRFYHSDKDTIDKVSLVSLKRAGIIAGTYLSFLANAGLDEAFWLCDRTLAGAKKRLFSGKDLRGLRSALAIEKESITSVLNVCRKEPADRELLRSETGKSLLKLDEAFRKAAKAYEEDSPATKEEKPKRKQKELVPVKLFQGVPLGWVLSAGEAKQIKELDELLKGIPAIEVFGWMDGKRTVTRIFERLSFTHELTIETLMKWLNKAAEYDLVKY